MAIQALGADVAVVAASRGGRRGLSSGLRRSGGCLGGCRSSTRRRLQSRRRGGRLRLRLHWLLRRGLGLRGLLSSSGGLGRRRGSGPAAVADGRGASGRDGGLGLLDGRDTALDQGRAGDGVLGQAVVDVHHDARVVDLVELCALDTGRGRGAGASDLEVEALWIVLRSILLPR